MTIIISILLSSGLSTSGAEKEIKIRWIGQACFLITTSDGTKILLDPMEAKDYRFPKGTSADIVTVSHNHFDHNQVNLVSGDPKVFYGCNPNTDEINLINTKVKGIQIYTVPSFHDPGHHGNNALFVFEVDGIRIAHLGDLGTTLTEKQIKDIGRIDILMIPVGGKYTIAGEDADEVIDQLHVQGYVIPMHFKTEAFDILPYTAEDFTDGKDNVTKISGNSFIIDLENMPEEREYIIMHYK